MFRNRIDARAPKFPTLRTIGQAVLSILVVAMGASLGREGAAKQTGAAIASRLSQWMKLPPAQFLLQAHRRGD